MDMKRIACLLVFCRACAGAAAEDAVRVRVHNFVVNPSTGPTTLITVTNPADHPVAGSLAARFPEGWRVTPASHPLRLATGAAQSFPFAVEAAMDDRRTNRYAVAVTVHTDGANVTQTQEVVWAGAPYFKPTIDGKVKEWADAVPISWTTCGRSTRVSQYWNKKHFCLLVQVDEERLIGLKSGSADSGMDAVQFALAPAGAGTGTQESDLATRHEFLVVDSGSRWKSDACFALTKPGIPLGNANSTADMDALRVKDADVVVTRSAKTTVYELAIPFADMPSLRPTAGREYCFSLLVHDPDGTGIRDLGSIMNLHDSQRRALAWRSWPHVKWGQKAPFDNKVEFGFCSSVH